MTPFRPGRSGGPPRAGSAMMIARGSGVPAALRTVTESPDAACRGTAPDRTVQAVTNVTRNAPLLSIVRTDRAPKIGQLQEPTAHSDRLPDGAGAGCDDRARAGLDPQRRARRFSPPAHRHPRDALQHICRAHAPDAAGVIVQRRLNRGLVFGRDHLTEGEVRDQHVGGGTQQARAGLRLPDPGVTAPFAVVGGRPYQIVFAPLRAPEIIAWVALGFELDQGLAEKLAALGGTEVSFIYHEPGAFNGYTSTLEPAMAGELAALSLHRPGASAPALMLLNDQECLTLSAPLRSQVGGLELVVQRSQVAAMAQFRDIRFALLLIGGAALLGAIIVAWLTGRSAVRPLGVLVNAASQIERGNYSAHIQVQGAR